MQKHKLLFFDTSLEAIDTYRKALAVSDYLDYDFVVDNIRNIVSSHDIHILVSPANSCGFMDGGIDAVYMDMFPGIEDRVKARIARCVTTETQHGIRALPIGSAILVSTGDPMIKLLACVPTMMMPGNIQGTYNVYWAMRGLLRLMDRVQCSSPIVVALPALGTGVGKLDPDVSAHQVTSAIDDHYRGNSAVCDPECKVDVVDEDLKWAYVLSGHATP